MSDDTMGIMHQNHPLRIFGISGILTLILGIVMFIYGGPGTLWLYLVLVLLEITFSFDNAVVNSKILIKLSPLWQTLFLTVGIFFAVFVVRFLLPVLIVMLTASLGGGEVLNLVINHPEEYGHKLDEAAPLINAFGGTFLVMIGLTYFVDNDKDVHWIRIIERALSKIGKIRFIISITMVIITAILYLTVPHELRNTVTIAALSGIALHVALEGISALFSRGEDKTKSKATHQVGMAAFASFMYLQILDASFSFDGVIGAFAITSSVLLIMAGLGAGALWVRSLTVYLVRTGTLAKYRYLEHGAHWAILVLGALMLGKIYHFELAEWMTGSIGLVFVVTAVATSVIERRAGSPNKGR